MPLLAAAESDEHSLCGKWRRAVPAVVLECAVRWAMEGNVRTTRVRKAAARAAKLDSEIMASAERLVTLIAERDEITREHGLSTEWGGPNLDVWDLIERASKDYPSWAMVCESERSAFLHLARVQSREGPELADVLRGVRSVHAGIVAAVHSGDAASLELGSGSALDGPAARLRRFPRQARSARPIRHKRAPHTPAAMDGPEEHCHAAVSAGPRARRYVGSVQRGRNGQGSRAVPEGKGIDNRQARSVSLQACRLIGRPYAAHSP